MLQQFLQQCCCNRMLKQICNKSCNICCNIVFTTRHCNKNCNIFYNKKKCYNISELGSQLEGLHYPSSAKLGSAANLYSMVF